MDEGEEVCQGSSDHIVETRRFASSWMQFPSSRLVYYKVTKLRLEDRFHRQIDTRMWVHSNSGGGNPARLTTFTSWSGSRSPLVFQAIASVIMDGLLIHVDLSSQYIFVFSFILFSLFYEFLNLLFLVKEIFKV